MSIVNPGDMYQGGMVDIQFPRFKIQLSVDNETELSTAIEMMKKALELHETEKAKMMLIRDVEQEKKRVEAEEQAERVQEAMQKMATHPPIFSAGVLQDSNRKLYESFFK